MMLCTRNSGKIMGACGCAWMTDEKHRRAAKKRVYCNQTQRAPVVFEPHGAGGGPADPPIQVVEERRAPSNLVEMAVVFPSNKLVEVSYAQHSAVLEFVA